MIFAGAAKKDKITLLETLILSVVLHTGRRVRALLVELFKFLNYLHTC